MEHVVHNRTENDVTTQNWQEVGDKLGGLALKLKLHFEESADGKVKAAADAACAGVEAAFDGLKASIDDPAIKQDVHDVAADLSDAVRNSFTEMRAHMQNQ